MAAPDGTSHCEDFAMFQVILQKGLSIRANLLR